METFEVGEVTVTKVSVSAMDNNAYLLAPASGPVTLIDAADDIDQLKELIGERELGAVITTHQHHDHVNALAELIAATGARAISGEPDAAAITEATGVAQETVWHGDQIKVGDLGLAVIGLVGHTPGSITLVLDGEPVHLFTGDSLFPGGVGKTNSPEEFDSLFNDVKTRIFDQFGDATVVHPGHGAGTTLGAERASLPQWKARGW